MARTSVGTMRRIGVLGGSSDQATADYYRRLNKAANDRFGGWNTAEVIISSMNFAFSRDCAVNGKWDDLAAYLSERTIALERAGADLVLCASNTLHRVADKFTRNMSIPFLHIVDPTAQAILNAGLKRVALLGTKTTMASDFLTGRYAGRFGIEILVPESDEQDFLDRIIFEELCRGQLNPRSKAAYLGVVDKLHARGAEGVILGCTEIPLLIAQADRPNLPMFDTTGLHVEAALTLAVRKGTCQ
jgi:aspartate racemase